MLYSFQFSFVSFGFYIHMHMLWALQFFVYWGFLWYIMGSSFQTWFYNKSINWFGTFLAGCVAHFIMSSQVKSRKWFSRSTWRKRMRSWCRWLDSNRWVWVLMLVICFYNDFTCALLFCCCSPGSFQIKDILKGALRFNQSQLEAEENEEITIADDHYTSTAAAETIINHHQQANSRQSQDSVLDASTEEKEGKEQAMTPPEQQVK